MKKISQRDWDRVHVRALAVANTSAVGDSKRSDLERIRLLRLLNALRKKYRSHPSILATKADYVQSDSYRVSLLQRALLAAQKSGTRANAKIILRDLRELRAPPPLHA